MTINKADLNLISYSSCHINPGHQSEHQSERHERLRRQRQLLRPGASLSELPRPCFCPSLVFEAPLSYLGSKGCCPSKENKINIRTALRNKAKACLNFLHLFTSDGSEAGRFKGRRELVVCAASVPWEVGQVMSGSPSALQRLLGSFSRQSLFLNSFPDVGQTLKQTLFLSFAFFFFPFVFCWPERIRG